jgi:hypothetical protein
MSRRLNFKVHSPDSDPRTDVDTVGPSAQDGADAFLAFTTETKAPAAAERQTRWPSGNTTTWPATRVFTVLVILATVVAAGAVAILRWPTGSVPVAAAPAAATLTVDSRPQGADVVIGGVLRGQTPLRVTVDAGRHEVGVTYGGVSRLLPLQIEAGSVVSQHVEFVAEPAAATGRLEIASEPQGAQVRIDGTPRGTTPLTISDIAPGEHTIVISSGDATVTRRVTVAAGATATVVASVTAPDASGGYVSFSAPFELQVSEGGRLVGTTAAERIMLPAGRHELELANPAFEYRRAVTVQVSAGRTSNVTAPIPNGSVSINALPWADVSIDGRPVGTTPLANLSVPVGRHEIVFRHPQLGERKQTVTVTATTPVRVGASLQ